MTGITHVVEAGGQLEPRTAPKILIAERKVADQPRKCWKDQAVKVGMKVGGRQMGDRGDRLSAARRDLDLLVGDLSTVRGQLEEFATMWRRQCNAKNSWLDMPHAFPQGLREIAEGLTGTLRALVEAGLDQDPGLARSAAAQLSALEAGLAAAIAGASRDQTAAVTADAGASTQPGAAAIRATMSRVRTRQQSLIAHLVKGQGMAEQAA